MKTVCSLQEHIERDIRARAEKESTPSTTPPSATTPNNTGGTLRLRELAAKRSYPEFRARVLKAWQDEEAGRNPNLGDPLTTDKLGHYLASREPNAQKTLHAVKMDVGMGLEEWVRFAAWANELLETALLDDELEAVEA